MKRPKLPIDLRPKKESWLDKNHRWVKIGIFLLTLGVIGSNVYLEVQDSQRFQEELDSGAFWSPPRGEIRAGHRSDQTRVFLKSIAGEWLSEETGDRYSISINGIFRVNSPDGSIDEMRLFGLTWPGMSNMFALRREIEGSDALNLDMSYWIRFTGPRTMHFERRGFDEPQTSPNNYAHTLKLVGSQSEMSEPASFQSPDQMIFECYQMIDRERLDFHHQICEMDKARTRYSMLTDNQTIDSAGDPVLSPDGTRILFKCREVDRDSSDLCVINSDGTGLRALRVSNIQKVRDFAINDKGQIAYVCLQEHLKREVSFDLCVVNSDGSGQRKLKNYPSGEYRHNDPMEVLINNDGVIVYSCHEYEGPADLCSIDFDGSDEKTVHAMSIGYGARELSMDKLGRVVFSCAFTNRYHHICLSDMRDGSYQQLTGSNIFLFENRNPKINSSGQIVFNCRHERFSGRYSLCGLDLLTERVWYIMPEYYFSDIHLDETGNVYASCTERTEERSPTFLCRVHYDGTGFVRIEIADVLKGIPINPEVVMR